MKKYGIINLFTLAPSPMLENCKLVMIFVELYARGEKINAKLGKCSETQSRFLYAKIWTFSGRGTKSVLALLTQPWSCSQLCDELNGQVIPSATCLNCDLCEVMSLVQLHVFGRLVRSCSVSRCRSIVVVSPMYELAVGMRVNIGDIPC